MVRGLSRGQNRHLFDCLESAWSLSEGRPVASSELRFGNVVLDVDRGGLRDRSGAHILLRPKSLDLLIALARSAGRVLSRDELFSAVWPNVTVTDDSLSQCVREIRRAIGDRDAKILRTVTKRGYRLDVEAPLGVAVTTPSEEASGGQGPPSLVVLPFQSIPSDPNNEWFADGIVEDITTALSSFRSLFVIARNSAFMFKGQSVDVREVGRQLRVRYVLEGSVRSANQQLRVTGQLIDAETGSHVWAGRFDGEMANIFELQDKITSAVVGALEPRVHRAEIERATRKPTSNMSAYDLYLRAIPGFYDRTKSGYVTAKQLLEEAVVRDNGFAQAKSMLARLWELGVFAGWEADTETARARALSLAREALSFDYDDPLVLARCGHVLTLLGGMHAEGATLLDRAIAANPNCAEAYVRGAWVSVWNGDFGTALVRADMSEQLDPLSLEGLNRLNVRAAANFFSRELHAAADLAQRALGRAPDYNSARRYLIASLSRMGRESEAKAQVAELLLRDPECTLARTRANNPFRHDWMIAFFLDALALAGVPSG
jgi:adenylate cyclase